MISELFFHNTLCEDAATTSEGMQWSRPLYYNWITNPLVAAGSSSGVAFRRSPSGQLNTPQCLHFLLPELPSLRLLSVSINPAFS